MNDTDTLPQMEPIDGKVSSVTVQILTDLGGLKKTNHQD